MSILARELSVLDYRSFDSFTLGLSSGVNVLVGHNAAGKTNLVEALQLLTAGQSFRKPSPAQLVREGCERGRAELSLEGEGRSLAMGLSFLHAQRQAHDRRRHPRRAAERPVLP